MKRISILLCTLVVNTGVLLAADRPDHSPAVGSWSIGFSFNPASLGSQLSVQPKTGDMAGEFIETGAGKTNQMFMLSQDPIAALRTKYHAREHVNILIGAGFSGSHINYSEYVADDLAKLLNPNSESKVVDQVRSDMNSLNASIGIEYTMGVKNLKFVAGGSLLYAMAGGKLNCAYGNTMTVNNPAPTTLNMVKAIDSKVNGFEQWAGQQGIAYARPTERYSKGYNHGLGLQLHAGVEYHFMDHLSLGAVATFTPVMFVLQPQTWIKYEGLSSISGQIENYTGLISPGSWMVLYGTQNLGLQLSLNYYF
ncbi:MAG: hypothetical protein MJZ75_06780 [Paludibacteraceae bacterium]|nr:hypothetical protein [Paludibacteraceae bacterium]